MLIVFHQVFVLELNTDQDLLIVCLYLLESIFVGPVVVEIRFLLLSYVALELEVLLHVLHPVEFFVLPTFFAIFEVNSADS